jgi:hypothetical protein
VRVKLGRNKPCWCGSGKKYKKCHLDREQQEPINQGVIHKQLNGFYSQKYCSVPSSMSAECSGKIIKAHSISKSSSLKEIANNGHVLTTFKGAISFENGFKISPKRIGIQKASTFTGFCSHHDKSLFQSIEDKDFIITKENCFLIAYRAVSREIFVKERSSGIFDLLKDLDKGKGLEQQLSMQSEHKRLTENNDLSLSDLKYIKSKLDVMLNKKDQGKLSHIVFTLSEPPKVMTSAAVGPTFDFQGAEVQSISQDPNVIPSYVIINSFSGNGAGYICLSWIEEHNTVVSKFVDSLKRTNSIGASLLAFIFTAIENNYLSEDWWSSLESAQKDYLMGLYSQGVMTSTYSDSLVNTKDLLAFKITATQRLNLCATAL